MVPCANYANVVLHPILFFSLLILAGKIAHAQDPWINALPFHYHASFAGSSDQARVATCNTFGMNDIYHGNNFSPAYKNYVSADKFIKKTGSGAGAELSYINAHVNLTMSKDRCSTVEARIAFAPKFSSKRRDT
jgi:hypothetical protein